MNDNKKITDSVLSFLSEDDKSKPKANTTPPELEQEMDCSSGVCVIKTGKGLIERINKRIITEDGRDLLIN